MFNLTGLILAGGKGQRMAGADKGLQLYCGRPLIAYSVELQSPFVDKVIISANRNIEQYRCFADRVVTDVEELSDVGPLAGVYAAIESVATSHILLLPCDTPKVSPQAIEALIEQARLAPEAVHFLSTESGQQPLHAVLPTAQVKAQLGEFLAQAEHFGVMKFYRQLGCAAVAWHRDSEMDNLNHLSQLEPLL